MQDYSPYWRVLWNCQWEEKPKKDLLSLVKTIVRALEKEAGEIARHVEEAEHRVELERKKEKRRAALRRTEETKRRAIQAQKASLKELKKVIDDWGEVNRIEQFFSNAESQCSQP